MGRSPKSNYIEHRMARALDELSEFEKFKDELLPELRGDLSRGMTAEEIYKKYEALAAARTVTIAIKETDSGKALAAAKDIRDRVSGKPKESLEIKNKWEKLKDEELDSLILSELSDVDEADLAN